jgi:hypothetical protein
VNVRSVSTAIRLNRTSWHVGAIVGLSASIGLLASYPALLAGITALLAMVLLGYAGEIWLLAIVVLPLGLSFSFLTDSPSSIAGLQGSSIDGLRLAVALGAFIVLVMRKPSIVTPVREVPLYILFLAFGAASLIWSPNIADGVRLFCKLAYPVAGFLIARRVLQLEGEARLIRFVRFAAVLSLMLNVAVLALGISPYAGTGYGERFGGASHPNTVGLFSAAVALILYAGWTKRGGWENAAVAALMALQLVATGSRTALVAGGAGFLLFELLRRRPRRIAAALALGILVWSMVPTFGARTLDSMSGEAIPELGSGPAVNLSGRMDLWMDAWSSLMGDNRAIGRGLGTTESFFTARYASLRSVHNGYLLLVIDTGIIGLLLATSFFGMLALKLISLAVRPDAFSIYPALALSALVMFLLASFTEGTFGGYAYPGLLWIAFALATYAQGSAARSAASGPIV